jgi:hypothetical protein
MSVPRRYTHSFGVVLTREEYDALTEAAAGSFMSKAAVAREGLEVWLDPRVSEIAVSLGKPRREVLRDALNDYFDSASAVGTDRKGRRRA